MKATMAHHPVILKEVQELLAKGPIEALTVGSGFSSNVFVVPKCSDGLWPILSLKQFKCYMYTPTFKMPTIKQVWQLIQQGHYAFPIDPMDAYLHITIVKHHHHFCDFLAK